MLRITAFPFQFVAIGATVQITEPALPRGAQESATIGGWARLHKGDWFCFRPRRYVLNASILRHVNTAVGLNNLARTIPTSRRSIPRAFKLLDLCGQSLFLLGGGALKNQGIPIRSCVLLRGRHPRPFPIAQHLLTMLFVRGEAETTSKFSVKEIPLPSIATVGVHTPWNIAHIA
jgi:hypothetical protein